MCGSCSPRTSRGTRPTRGPFTLGPSTCATRTSGASLSSASNRRGKGDRASFGANHFTRAASTPCWPAPTFTWPTTRRRWPRARRVSSSRRPTARKSKPSSTWPSCGRTAAGTPRQARGTRATFPGLVAQDGPRLARSFLRLFLWYTCSMSLDIKSREERGVTVVVPRGRLTLDYGSRLHDEVKRVVEGGARRVLIPPSPGPPLSRPRPAAPLPAHAPPPRRPAALRRLEREGAPPDGDDQHPAHPAIRLRPPHRPLQARRHRLAPPGATDFFPRDDCTHGSRLTR